MSIEECRRNIAMYNTMSECVSKIIDFINNSKDSNDKVLFKINQNYSLNNDNSIIYGRVLDLSNDISETSNYLSNVVLPTISAAIKDEYDTIDYIYYLIELEEEKKRAEAEAAAAAEAEATAASAAATTTTTATTVSKPSSSTNIVQ